MTQEQLDNLLEQILNQYQQAFAERISPEESTEEDDLMLAFGLTQDIKTTNKQYWGRQLGSYLKSLTQFDLQAWLRTRQNRFIF
ncbi:MAG: hypothetical protein RID53_08770 [Coleofasciculus sp. B1-GNL1-01]|uniref:hypothetical protein n=1 Tax=Coleofasciculus sp. B1-GNL1-01 TaxID=3068484 RepID=UPI0032F59BC2